MRRARLWLILPLLLLGVAVAAYLLWYDRPRDVAVAQARTGRAVELVYATGFVEPEHPVSVASRLTAPVTRVLVDEGDRVRRGQALVLLDDADQRQLLAQAQAQLRGKSLIEQRTLALYRRGWVTRAARDSAVAEADSARAAERAARARLDQDVVRAGIDGVVIKRDVEPGDLASPTRVLMLLGNPAEVRITATVDERDIPRVRPGQTALLSSDAWPGRVIRGRVREITPSGDPSQRAFRARLVLSEPASVPFGMSLEVNIVTGQVDRALLIPRSAVRDSHVWTVSDGRAVQRPVRTGIAGAEDIQIVSGLRRGEIVIVSPPPDLRKGSRVRAAVK